MARLGIATLIVLAIMGAGGALAQAASQFEAEDLPATISGEQQESHVFTVEGENKVTCNKATFSASVYEPTETISVTPSYSECTAFGLSATVSVNGCAYTLHSGAEIAEYRFRGTLDVVCPEGKKIVTVAGTCEIQVGSQSGLSEVEYEDNVAAEPDTVMVRAKASKFKYNKTKDGFLCPLNGTGEKEDGVYTGNSKGSASWESEALGLSVAQKQNTKFCKEQPSPLCKSQYLKGTAIEASLEVPAQETTKMLLSQSVECGESKLSGTTKENEGAPLNVEKISLSFSGCITKKNTKCTSVRTEAATVEGSLEAVPVTKGTGYFAFPVTLILECGKEINCKYESKTNKLKQVALLYRGAMAPTIRAENDPFGKVAIVGEEGCTATMTLIATYGVVSPVKSWLGI